MITDAVTMEVTIGMLNDCAPGEWLCATEDVPGLMGHGHTASEAIEDLRTQYEEITWH